MKIPQGVKNLRKKSFQKTSKCFIEGCIQKPIKSHSIANSKILQAISDNGKLLYYSTEEINPTGITLTSTGRGKATTFPGFCAEHDNHVFRLIDDCNYKSGNIEQQFLFALRACAREYTTRMAMDFFIQKLIEQSIENEELKLYYTGYNKGTEDLKELRQIFNRTHAKSRYWRFETIEIVFNQPFPIAASSVFKIEKDQNGTLINQIHDLRHKQHPVFLTVFPQENKTYSLITYNKKDASLYSDLKLLSKIDELEQKILLSNIICSYVENFVVNPIYWGELPEGIKVEFQKQWGYSVKQAFPINLVENTKLNIFIDH